MRLTSHELDSIKSCARRHFGEDCTVTLFGSRADDAKMGGDIDLHILVHDDRLAKLSSRVSYLVDLEALIGERKVDLLAEGPAVKNGYIDDVARSEGVIL